jgi:CubicO group peptidase (beta-lactamase class C family)
MLPRRAGVAIAALVLVASCGASERDTDTSSAASSSSSAGSSAPTSTDDPNAPNSTDSPDSTVGSSVAPRWQESAADIDLPEQPDGVPFPTDEWPEGPLPEGVDRAEIEQLTATVFRGPGEANHVRSLVVIHQGRLVHEAYHPLYDRNTVNLSYSIAKSVTSAAIGVLVGDGLVSLDDPAPVMGWTDDRGDITVEQLLHMASGLEWLEVYGEGSAPFRMFAAPDASDSAAQHPLVAEPGSTFNYSTGTTAILAQIVTDAAWAAERGAPVDPAAEPDADAGPRLLDERIFAPLGITSVQLQRDPEGTFLGGVGANMTSRDFARFGLLYLRGGVWDGERILPEGWVEYSFTSSPANRGYGAQWWLEPRSGRYEARGLFGQIISIVPDEDLIVVVNSEAGGAATDLVNGVIREFRDR